MPQHSGDTAGVTSASYEINGRDFERAGEASDTLKRTLKKLGVKPEIVRRVGIAAYEAEMNVAIHARTGRMHVMLDPHQIDVTVTDEGPGIPDIQKAMLEGFSTAPDYARQLGFGAGMGLPNIRKCSDRLTIESEAGRSTTLRFRIFLEAVPTVGEGRNSLRIHAAHCTMCLRCVNACPTGALRVRNGAPTLLPHLCIDCNECLAACKTNSLSLACDEPFPDPGRGALTVMNTACTSQFGRDLSREHAEAILARKDFQGIRYLEEWEIPLLAAVVRYAEQKERTGPVIAPTCPAILNLIAVKFPALLPLIAPYLSPIEAAAAELADVRVVFAAACPSQATAVTSGRSQGRHRVGSARSLNRSLQALVAAGKALPGASMDPEANAPSGGGLRIYGIRYVMRILEQVENGLLNNIPVLIPYACDLGCFGSPLMIGDPFTAQHAFLQRHKTAQTPGRVFERSEPLHPRPGLRLDPDMRQAIAKLVQIDELKKRLPGRDCGVCGAPTCEALAEDVVLGRAEISACPYRTTLREDSP